MRLANYEFEIIYKPGKENTLADMLSRLPEEDDQTPIEKDFQDMIIACIDQDPQVSNQTQATVNEEEIDESQRVHGEAIERQSEGLVEISNASHREKQQLDDDIK